MRLTRKLSWWILLAYASRLTHEAAAGIITTANAVLIIKASAIHNAHYVSVIRLLCRLSRHACALKKSKRKLEIANGMLGIQCYQFIGLNERIEGYSKMIEQHALLNADARRLMRMPGIGPITASAIVATIGDAKQFRKGRDLAAWLGLTPLNKSSGGKERLGKITKQGDRYIRKLLVVGMTSRAVMAKRSPEKVDLRTAKIIANKPFRLATTAMANKAARAVWAMLTKMQEYRQPAF